MAVDIDEGRDTSDAVLKFAVIVICVLLVHLALPPMSRPRGWHFKILGNRCLEEPRWVLVQDHEPETSWGPAGGGRCAKHFCCAEPLQVSPCNGWVSSGLCRFSRAFAPMGSGTFHPLLFAKRFSQIVEKSAVKMRPEKWLAKQYELEGL